MIGDMNATYRSDDRTSTATGTSNKTYPADRACRKFLNSNNLSPCREEAIRPWTHCQATHKIDNNKLNTRPAG
eukprot:1132248-Pelagomonas_calceolata.AAC.1